MSFKGTKLRNQMSTFHEVNWKSMINYNDLVVPPGQNDEGDFRRFPSLDTDIPVTKAPKGLKTGMKADYAIPPYWTYSYKIDSKKGLVISNVNVKDSQGAGTTEEVFEKIEFCDFKVFFDDGTSVDFNVEDALTNSSAIVLLQEGEEGTRIDAPAPPDKLFQRGIHLFIKKNVLQESGGNCIVYLSMSIVFRGSKNDFDPGEVPVAMLVTPQFSLSWDNDRATKRVSKFVGSVKMTARNKMHHSHVHHGDPINENVASCFTDSNTGFEFTKIIGKPKMILRPIYYSGARADLASVLRLPLGWGVLFDYVLLDLQKEREIVAVYGPSDGNKYRNERKNRYEWIPSIASPGIDVRKAPRQGMYDNIHLHAKMASSDIKNNVQIHAPFCGHSCVHFHWRWSNTSSWGYLNDNDAYKGWDASGAFSLHDAPLVPPNQKVTVAICRHDANDENQGNSFSDEHILNPASLGTLHPLRKMIWYKVEMVNPNAGEAQVAMEHGIGWAFRYATPEESSSVKGLSRTMSSNLPWRGIPTQHELSAFFEDDVYPFFRYKGNDNQVPDGTNNKLYSGGTGTSMEKL